MVRVAVRQVHYTEKVVAHLDPHSELDMVRVAVRQVHYTEKVVAHLDPLQ
jgi:hypothetical protein